MLAVRVLGVTASSLWYALLFDRDRDSVAVSSASHVHLEAPKHVCVDLISELSREAQKRRVLLIGEGATTSQHCGVRRIKAADLHRSKGVRVHVAFSYGPGLWKEL